MTQTTNYELNIVEGTDVVNPLVQTNPNFQRIDEVMKANEIRGVATATEVKSGTNHAITRNVANAVFRFVATSDFRTGDTFSVDGTTVTATLSDGSLPKDRAFVVGTSVICILDGIRLTFVNCESSPVEVDADNVEMAGGTSVEDFLALTPGVVTFDSNWGGSSAVLNKFGHLCTLWMRYQTGLSTDFTNGIIGHLPEGFVPSDAICIPCVKLDDTGVNVTGNGYIVFINNATRDIAYYGDAFHFKEYIQLNGSWMI